MSKILAIIAEYNPFHNGHLYHFHVSKKILEPDYLALILGLIRANNLECAVLAYKQMIDMLASRYGVYLEDLQYDAEDREMFDTGGSRKRVCFDCQTCLSHV